MPGELQVSQVPSVVGKELAGGGLGGVGEPSRGLEGTQDYVDRREVFQVGEWAWEYAFIFFPLLIV